MKTIILTCVILFTAHIRAESITSLIENFLTPSLSEMMDAEFGHSISVSGNRATVGAFRSNGGEAFIFEYNGYQWEQTKRLIPSDRSVYPDDGFGLSVSMSGNRVLIGAPFSDTKGENLSGAVYVFEFDGNDWIETAKLLASNHGYWHRFGMKVSLKGDIAVIAGQYNYDDNGNIRPAVYKFENQSNNTWSETQKIDSPEIYPTNWFGTAIAFDQNFLFVGDFRSPEAGSAAGAVYVYKNIGQSWFLLQTLTASDAFSTDLFGRDLDVYGDNLLIGAYQDDDQGGGSGSVYAFKYDGNQWIEAQKLLAKSMQLGDNQGDSFGYSISMSGARALIGAHWDQDNGTESGSAYLFEYDGQFWTQKSKFIAGDGAPADEFGTEVYLDKNWAMVGAVRSDMFGFDSGAVYVRDIDLIFKDGFEN